MTSLHERVDYRSDYVDHADEYTEAAFVLGDMEFDVRESVATLPGLAETDTGAESRDRFGTSVGMLLGSALGVFTRPPKRPRRERQHYPPRFSMEFPSSIVDRELRRL